MCVDMVSNIMPLAFESMFSRKILLTLGTIPFDVKKEYLANSIDQS